MQRDQQASPLPPDPRDGEDIMSDEERKEDLIRGNRQDAPLPGDPADPEDVLRPESEDGPAAGG